MKKALARAVLKIRIQPMASKEGIEISSDGILKVKVNKPPVQGAANKRMIELLSKKLNVAKTSFIIKTGEKSRDKILQINGVSDEYVKRVLGF